MCPDVEATEPGQCPKCNMDLVPKVVEASPEHADHGEEAPQWTCGMHPSIRSEQPGKCPVCNMDLVPVGKGAASGLIELDAEKASLAGLEHAEATYMPLVKKIWAVGEVDYDETRVEHIASRIPGRIEDLSVDFTGAQVSRGDVLLTIYSPQLITALREYQRSLERAAGGGAGAEELAESSRRKLVLWGLTDQEIDRVASLDEIPDEIPVRSPIDGTVIERTATEGKYVKEGENLYVIADLSSVWITSRVYEEDISYIEPGDEVTIVADAFPKDEFPGRVSYIDAYLDKHTRTLGVRVDAENPDEKLKPGMYARASFEIPLSREEGFFYTCPMHPDVVSAAPGECPDCGMFLERVEGGRVLAVPRDAVVRAAKASVVYVRRGEWSYEPRQVKLGEAASLKGDGGGSYYHVLDGLMPGDVVVTRGSFLLDSQARLTGQAASAYGGALSVEPGSGHQH
jgi:Cu(I)/Ag(I) efflux system membrane fusion protein